MRKGVGNLCKARKHDRSGNSDALARFSLLMIGDMDGKRRRKCHIKEKEYGARHARKWLLHIEILLIVGQPVVMIMMKDLLLEEEVYLLIEIKLGDSKKNEM